MGTFMMIFSMFSGFGIGWGKPVPVNSGNLRTGRLGMALVSVAGVVANLIIAAVCALPLRGQGTLLDSLAGAYALDAARFLLVVILVNLSLAVFNLIPVFPLDGFNMLASLSPRSWAPALRMLHAYGPFILLLLIISGQVFHVDILGAVMRPIVRALLVLMLGRGGFGF